MPKNANAQREVIDKHVTPTLNQREEIVAIGLLAEEPPVGLAALIKGAGLGIGAALVYVVNYIVQRLLKMAPLSALSDTIINIVPFAVSLSWLIFKKRRYVVVIVTNQRLLLFHTNRKASRFRGVVGDMDLLFVGNIAHRWSLGGDVFTLKSEDNKKREFQAEWETSKVMEGQPQLIAVLKDWKPHSTHEPLVSG